MKYVLHYAVAPGVDGARIRDLFPAHRSHWAAFRADGTLLAIGPMEDPEEGALAVFTSRAAAERFAESDPFVMGGVVGSWDVSGWREAILEPLGGGPPAG
ncbi:MAG TPA: YciI family protein [Propionicimonas sp.]|jgi:hypothetical protein